MDRLLQCAQAFDALLDVEYHVVIGRKGNTIALTVKFSALDFHHLMGLGKLKDLRIATQNREDVFGKILSGSINYDTICKSTYISQIENRFYPLAHLEQLFDDNRLIFRYNSSLQPFSSIVAKYLLSTCIESQEIYIFIDQQHNCDNYFCRSFFPREDKNYTLGQTVYTLLRKEKVRVSTGEVFVQYNRLH